MSKSTKAGKYKYDKAETDRLAREGADFTNLKRQCAVGLGMSFARIELYAKASAGILQDVPQWGKYCIVPFCEILRGVANGALIGGGSKRTVTDPENLFVKGTIEAGYAAMLWSLTGRVYRINPELNVHFGFCDEQTIVPAAIFQNFPERSIYVSTPGLKICSIPIRGFFAYTDFHPSTGALMNFVFIEPDGNLRIVRLQLAEKPLHQCILEGSLLQDYTDARVSQAARYSEINPQACVFADEPNAEFKRHSLYYAVSRLLLIASENVELYDMKRGKEIKRLQLKTERELAAPCSFHARNVPLTLVSVGDNITVEPDSKLYFHLSDDKTTSELRDRTAEETLTHTMESIRRDQDKEQAAAQISVGELKSLQNKLEEALATGKKLKARCEASSANEKLLSAQLSVVQEKYEDANQQLEALRCECEALRQTQRTDEEKRSELAAEVDRVLTENHTLGEENRTLREELERSREKLEELKSITNLLNSKTSELAASAHAAEAEKDKYLNLYLALSNEHDAAVREIAALKSELAAVRKASRINAVQIH